MNKLTVTLLGIIAFLLLLVGITAFLTVLSGCGGGFTDGKVELPSQYSEEVQLFIKNAPPLPENFIGYWVANRRGFMYQERIPDSWTINDLFLNKKINCKGYIIILETIYPELGKARHINQPGDMDHVVWEFVDSQGKRCWISGKGSMIALVYNYLDIWNDEAYQRMAEKE